LLQLGLPDALDLMVICAEAGLSLDASLTRVSRELEPTRTEISEELGITAAELTFLPERRQAFENLNERTNLASVRGVVNTLLQTAKFGTPLAQSLRVLAAEYREARIVRAEEKAARLPAMLTVPMILFILPTLFIVLLGPAALNIIDTFSGKKGAQTTTVQSNGAGAGAGDPTTVVDKTKPSSGASTSSGGGTVIIESRDPTAPPEPDVELLPTKRALRILDPVVVDLDARKLRTGFQHRLAVVPTGTPDKIADAAAFARDSVPVQPSRMRVFTAARAAGTNEVRLYYIPQFGTDLVVAARVTIEVAPGAPGATEVSQLIREASDLGQTRFASNDRDRSLTIEGQFLRSETRTADQLASVASLRSVVDPGKAYAAIFLGWTEPQASSNGGPREVLCLAAADDPALQARTGTLRAGEPLVVRGTPSGWATVFDTTAIILRSCQIAP